MCAPPASGRSVGVFWPSNRQLCIKAPTAEGERPPPPTRVRHLHQEPASHRAPLEGERTGIPLTNRLEPIRQIHQTQPEKKETGIRDKPGSRGGRRPGLADAGGDVAYKE
ncbi:leucine-rich repeat and fibronectin type-III domain-containing protein 5 [Striga asiatica]|uniref:Leucine-rich repeat and fibronectin type-III domain-containing protein 5 n=1 Tax=Striga asiatica TaxID=4170 RepID=A0A5A7QRD6_STRAF|nr:leucine-rich repeat and fibronectin type-III domain-containing protein 5 [Striga asiatica]